MDEFLISLSPNAPQVICLTEHYLQTEEIGNVNFGHYTLGATFCRQTYKHGDVCIYVSKNVLFNTINLDQYNKEKTLKFVPWSYAYYKAALLWFVFIDPQQEILLIF